MSDHERGAYSPQTDAPLAFDARQPRGGGGGGGFPTTLVISLVILAVLVVAIVLFYRSGIRSAGEGPAPIGAPVAQIKSPPPPGAQPSDEGAGLQIYKAENQPAAPPPPPAYAAPPEQPQPRPTAPVQPQGQLQAHPTAPVAAQVLPPAAAAAGATTPAQSNPAAGHAAPPAAKPAPKDEIGALLDRSAAPAAKPAPVAKAAAPAAKPAASPASTGGGTSVQIGAYSSEDLAVKGWNGLATLYPSDMSGKGQHFEPVGVSGKTLYRATVTGFASHAAAAAFCGKLKTASHPCIVK